MLTRAVLCCLLFLPMFQFTMSAAASTPSSSPLRVLLIGVGAAGTLAGALAEGLLQAQYADRIKLSVLSRPLAADATDAKKAAVASLKSRGVPILLGSASAGAAALESLFRGFDVVVSSVGTRAQHEQVILIEAAKLAGVRWFIPSQFGFDVTAKGSVLAALCDRKIDDLAAIKAAGMDWTVVNTVRSNDLTTARQGMRNEAERVSAASACVSRFLVRRVVCSLSFRVRAPLLSTRRVSCWVWISPLARSRSRALARRC